MEGCALLFHTAAQYELWSSRAKAIYQSNVQGTRNIMEAALLARVPRVIHTSSVATVGRPRLPGQVADESFQQRWRALPGPYERSKYLSEQQVLQMVREKGLPAVIVNPSAPIGLYDSKPTPTGRIIVDLLRGKTWGYLPGGMNIVDVEDVAEGHLLAAEKGRIGERYILGGEDLTFQELFTLVCQLGGRAPPTLEVAYPVALAAAYLDEGLLSRILRRPPNIPIVGVKLARHRMFFDSSKAQRELGYTFSPATAAIHKAVLWFRFKRMVR
jgi:dihydroflavonol-4-reductase